MNMKRNIFRAFSASVVFLTALSCSLDETADVKLVELGTPLEDNVCIVEAEGGEYELEIYSNGSYHIEMLDQSSWLTLSAMKGNGDGTLTLTSTGNDEFKRMTSFALCSDVDERRDTVYVKQKGKIEANLSMGNTSMVVPGAGGESKASLSTNIPFEYFKVNVDYNDPENVGWLDPEKVSMAGDGQDRTLSIWTDPNPDDVSVRTASLNLSFVDGWGDKVALELIVMQKNSNEGLGVLKSFAEIRSTYPNGGEVTEDYILEGIVVSNTEGGNAGENEQISASAIDYTVSQRTVYVQSLDGKYGFSLLTETEEDNIFKQFNKVQVLLKGTEIYLFDNPAKYYQIKGVKKSMVASNVKAAESEIVVKQKHFNELTDDDIFTYVTLKDVEFPVRKGSICPINEGYSIAGKSDRIAKFPLLVRDINGDSFYMYTNTVCTYRNDGTRVPQGSGNISGVIVHERFSRFEWKNGMDLLDMETDPELGNIGRYQIRHQTKSDIYDQMQMDFKDSFSELLVEYRYWNPDIENGVQRPTYGDNGWFTHTYQKKYTGTEAKEYTEEVYKQHMSAEVCFSYLGPIGLAGTMFGANTGNVNGLGIVLDSDKDRYNPEMSEWVGEFNGTRQWLAPETSMADAEIPMRVANAGSGAGKGWCSSDCYCAFRSLKWWDFDQNRGYAWMLNFSTKGVSSKLSMQISVLNSSQRFHSPRYWKAEWSEVDSMDPSKDAQWHPIGEYTVPDISQWTGTLFSSVVGYKAINMDLPAELLGKDNVYIRLMPVNDLCSSGGDYTDTFITDDEDGDKHASSIDYIAIRYNK
ncbi:MAG: BACON domain-containing protein [Bacteroidales bacterium]|nr:BACON domain-containing protein [Bacteroidales bacterium]